MIDSQASAVVFSFEIYIYTRHSSLAVAMHLK